MNIMISTKRNSLVHAQSPRFKTAFITLCPRHIQERFKARSWRFLFGLSVGAFMLGCGPHQPSKQSIRDRLRSNSDVAFSKPTRPAQSSDEAAERDQSESHNAARSERGQDVTQEVKPEGVSCLDALSCFPRALYLSAEGMGASPRAAEIDAKDQVAAQISSTINSSLTLKTVEGDNASSHTQGEIKRQVTVRFERAELIETLRARSTQLKGSSDGYRVIGYLSLARYRAATEPELERDVRELESLLEGAERAQGAEVFVRQWSELRRRQAELKPTLAQYQTITQSDPPAYQTLKSRIIALEKRALKHRRRAHVIIETQEDQVASRELRDLLKSIVRRYGVRVSAPGRCLKGDYLLRVDIGVEEKIHQLTGSALKKLHAGVTLAECGEEAGVTREVATRALPSIRGVTRYNSSANVAIKRQLKRLIKHNQRDTLTAKTSAERSTADKLKAFREAVDALLMIVIPAL